MMMEEKDVEYVPALYKIFDEILVNAADNKQRDPSMKEIRIKIDIPNGCICIKNGGRGIPISIQFCYLEILFEFKDNALIIFYCNMIYLVKNMICIFQN